MLAALLVLLPSLLSVQTAEPVCSAVPPSLWCENKQLAVSCGFSELCNRYIKVCLKSGERVFSRLGTSPCS